MLKGIGIELVEEQVYAALVVAPADTVAELAQRTGLPEPDVEGAVAQLRRKGLVALHPGCRHRLRAEPPDVTLSLMALRRIEEVRKAQAAIAQLVQVYHGQRHPAEVPVEVVAGAQAIGERYAQIQRDSREEIRSLVRPPVIAVAADANTGQREALRAGVRYRVVYDRSALDLDSPENPLLLEEWAGLGEEMRVAADVPLKMVISDDRLALVTTVDTVSQAATGLVIHSRPLVEPLAWIFQKVWESALPVPAALAAAAEGPLTAGDRRLLSSLLAGYTDEAIATQQGVSLRTVQRRVRRLLTLAGVQSRVQLGWQAARRNWI
jgi:sugar-specific transcriptional regulator TrmB/DNA-binding CsgD family transcriptional regulator